MTKHRHSELQLTKRLRLLPTWLTKHRHSELQLTKLLRLLPTCLILLMPTLALAQAGDDLFVGPFEQVAVWLKAVGGIMLVIGVSLLGYRMSKGDGSSIGGAIGLMAGGVLMMSAQPIKDALWPG